MQKINEVPNGPNLTPLCVCMHCIPLMRRDIISILLEIDISLIASFYSYITIELSATSINLLIKTITSL